MSLTPNQEKFIRTNLQKFTQKEFAKQFGVEQKVIQDYVNELKVNKTPKWFYLILVLVPLLLLSLLEITLKSVGYGDDYSVFKPLSSEYPGMLVFNPDYPKKYFQNSNVTPSVIPDAFYEAKKENSFRVFVLGGSTTAGFPFSYNASFARRVKRRIEILYPQIDAEVINMGISAVNSYTIKDILQDVIENKPDLVLIYAGHNEYYGALGVGSTEYIGSANWLVSLNLKLRDFKIYQLISNSIKSIQQSLFAKQETKGKTLMEQMVSEKLIDLNSKIYNNGLEQFYSNLNEVLKLLKQNKINTIISTVASNLKQKPFESINTEDLSADKHFSLGDENFEKGNYKLAKLNYISAKEKDALRFRAPEKINEIIKDFGNIYNVPVANTDSILSKKSIGEITGYNLMVDHLHPNVKAHQLIGDLFFETMIENSFLPKSEKQKYTLEDQLKFADNSLAYTKFDSTYAKIVLSNLLNTYPFTTQTEPKSKTYSLITSIDSLAEKVVIGEISWEKGHYLAAEIYFENDEYDLFLSEMNTLIQDKPFIKYNYTYAVDKLRSVGKLDVALQLLIKMNRKFNDEYSAKLIGNIGISKKSYSLAIYFYKKFIDLNQNDPDVFYNISGAYLYSKMVDKAIISLEKCLEISPNYPNAKSTLERLQRAKQ